MGIQTPDCLISGPSRSVPLAPSSAKRSLVTAWYAGSISLEKAVETTKDTKDTKRKRVPARSRFTRQVRYFDAGKTHSQPLFSCVSCLSWFISTGRTIGYHPQWPDQRAQRTSGRRRAIRLGSDHGHCRAPKMKWRRMAGGEFDGRGGDLLPRGADSGGEGGAFFLAGAAVGVAEPRG